MRPQNDVCGLRHHAAARDLKGRTLLSGLQSSLVPRVVRQEVDQKRAEV